jgi:hypothetical protein
MTLLTVVLAGVVGAGLAAVAVYFWPTIMGWAREHLLPWVDVNVPDLAGAVRLAFHDLDRISVELRRAVRTTWWRLRQVLLGQVATFVEARAGEWAVQITSSLRAPRQAGRPVVEVVTEQRLDWGELPEEIRAQALANGLRDVSLDVMRARDRLLSEPA